MSPILFRISFALSLTDCPPPPPPRDDPPPPPPLTEPFAPAPILAALDAPLPGTCGFCAPISISLGKCMACFHCGDDAGVVPAPIATLPWEPPASITWPSGRTASVCPFENPPV